MTSVIVADTELIRQFMDDRFSYWMSDSVSGLAHDRHAVR